MARKQTSKSQGNSTQNTVEEQTPVQTTAQVQETPQTETKKRQPKQQVQSQPTVQTTVQETKQTRQPRQQRGKNARQTQEVVEEVVEEDDVEDEEVVETEGGTRKRVFVTRESVMESFDELVNEVNSQIEMLRTSESKTKGVRFLRTLNKRLKNLRNQTRRVMKQKQKTNRTKNPSNSGFMKPVVVSKEMSKFAGWKPEDRHSRVEVTKYICDYIKQHNLQNSTDKRQILPDVELQRLLKLDPKSNVPLTYYRLQTEMKKLFPKE